MNQPDRRIPTDGEGAAGEETPLKLKSGGHGQDHGPPPMELAQPVAHLRLFQRRLVDVHHRQLEGYLGAQHLRCRLGQLFMSVVEGIEGARQNDALHLAALGHAAVGVDQHVA